jgi:hypothetical protein
VLMSDGANAICWGTAGGGSSPATPTVEGILYGLTNPYNTAVGRRALSCVTTGCRNTAHGSYALYYNTTGCYNTAIGNEALYYNTTGSYNTTVGALAGAGITTGCHNTVIGYSARVADPTGSNQLSIGRGFNYWLRGDCTYAIQPGAGIIDCAGVTGTAGQVLMSNGANAICWGTVPSSSIPCACITAKGALITGSAANTPVTLPVGTNGQVLIACSTASSGLCWGTPAGEPSATPTVEGVVFGCTNSTGTALGCGAGVGVLNAAIGNCALRCATSTSCYNTALGTYAGCMASVGLSNTFIGQRAGCNLTNGCNNVAIGACTTFANPTGSRQLVIGWDSTNYWMRGDAGLDVCFGARIWTTGIYDCEGKCGVANQVLGSDGAGSIQWRTICSATPGGEGLVYGCTGGFETSLGFCAGTSQNSTTIGHYAGRCTTTGFENTLVGACAGWQITSGCNLTVLGWEAQPSSNSACNEVTLGNNKVTALRANVTSISSLSDERDKTAIIALPVGLDFVKAIKPVKFTWQRREPNEVMDGKSEAGFIAQDLQATQNQFNAADYLGLVQDGNPERLEAAPGKLIPVLVKAIQELSEKVDSLQSELDALKGN